MNLPDPAPEAAYGEPGPVRGRGGGLCRWGPVPAAASAGPVASGIGVGPHPEPWPDDPRLDPELLAGGDRRNVVDRYRYWSVEAIRADLAARAHPLHIAIENVSQDNCECKANSFLFIYQINRRRLASLFENGFYLRHVDAIFDRFAQD